MSNKVSRDMEVVALGSAFFKQDMRAVNQLIVAKFAADVAELRTQNGLPESGTITDEMRAILSTHAGEVLQPRILAILNAANATADDDTGLTIEDVTNQVLDAVEAESRAVYLKLVDEVPEFSQAA